MTWWSPRSNSSAPGRRPILPVLAAARLWAALLALAAAACQPGAALTPPAATAPVTLALTAPAVTGAPATPSSAAPASALPPTPASSSSPSASPSPASSRPAYDLQAKLDLSSHIVSVREQVSLAPPASDELVFNFNALQMPGVVENLSVQVDGAQAAPQSDGVWLHLPLPAGAIVGELLTVTIAYDLVLPSIEPWAWAWRGTLGYTPAQLNLGDWYPVLAWHSAAEGWVMHLPSPLGEYTTTPAADYAVRFSAADGQTLPLLVGSGAATTCGADQCFSLHGGRFAAYVAATGMASRSTVTAGGQMVTSLYLPEHAAGGEAALQTAASALAVFSQRYGVYPFPTFSLVEGDFYDGMEYSGLSFVGRSYYAEYDGTPRNLLAIISAHETAHQWWHTLVGNDQAAEPWLDEALATYSELVFLEAKYPAAVDWWWAYRVDAFKPTGRVDGSIYDFLNFREYVDAVYLRGAQMLQAMRLAIGDERFFSFLKQYAAAHAGGVATGTDFWQAYAEAGGDPAAVRGQFMRP